MTIPALHSRSISLCHPSVRMVAINAYTYEGDEGMATHVTIYPILAIRSSYSSGEECIEDEFLIYAEDELSGRPIELNQIPPWDELARDACDYGRVVCCPWPQSEDDERLAPVIAQMQSRTEAAYAATDAAENN